MLIRAGFDMAFDVAAATPMLLMLFLHPSRGATARRPDKITTEPYIPITTYIDAFGNQVGRIVAPAGRLRLWNDVIIEDSGQPDSIAADAVQHPVDEVPDDCVQFLLPSRYCEVDRMVQMAWDLFGRTPPGWARVQAICDWAHSHVEFGYSYASTSNTAMSVCESGKGVCRDFTHLAVALCRAMNIPARYVTGYLGDIGVPPVPYPMDFSAWFEVYLSGRWHTFDARHNKPRIGRVLMARGRDAVDVALTTSFGSTNLQKFVVWTDEVGENALSKPPAPVVPTIPPSAPAASG
ncbi:MAG TPA: transglutaminase family protein [Tepidisphaeraceae bacterium]|nr:transglutaminase family protein [Tepidisphaeraceae bacterium]